MYYNNNGIAMFNDFNDLIYNYFLEMGLCVNNQYLCFQETRQVLQFKGKYIKASVNGIPVYPGLNDVVFDPAHNYGMMATLFGLFLDQSQDTDDGDILQGYIAHYLEDNADRTMQRVTVKTVGRGEISSNFYHNVFLGYIDCTFRVAGTMVDLSVFDVEYPK